MIFQTYIIWTNRSRSLKSQRSNDIEFQRYRDLKMGKDSIPFWEGICGQPGVTEAIFLWNFPGNNNNRNLENAGYSSYTSYLKKKKMFLNRTLKITKQFSFHELILQNICKICILDIFYHLQICNEWSVVLILNSKEKCLRKLKINHLFLFLLTMKVSKRAFPKKYVTTGRYLLYWGAN